MSDDTTITVDLGHLPRNDRDEIHARATAEDRDDAAVVLDLIRAGLRGGVHNVNTGAVTGVSIQAGSLRSVPDLS